MLQNTARDVQPGHWRTASTAATAAFSSLWFAHDRQPRGISARYFPSTGSLAPSGQGRANEVFLLLVCVPMKGGTLWYLCGSHCLSFSLSWSYLSSQPCHLNRKTRDLSSPRYALHTPFCYYTLLGYSGMPFHVRSAEGPTLFPIPPGISSASRWHFYANCIHAGNCICAAGAILL